MSDYTKAQLGALKWLIQHNGDGVFDKNQVLVAAGERAGVMRSTWSKLEKYGLVERYMGGRRAKVTDAGSKMDLSGVHASDTAHVDIQEALAANEGIGATE